MPALHITRIINPCILIEIGDKALLTDPYFEDNRLFPMREPIGLHAADLPALDAVLGGHQAPDHWRPRHLVPHVSLDVEVFAATPKMVRQARRAGFTSVSHATWGDTFATRSGVTIECVPGEKVMAGTATSNNYVLHKDGLRVYIGTEANHLDPIRDYARDHTVDVAVLPIDGLSFRGHQLVMTAVTALEAATLLGASHIVPIHYSQRSVRGILNCQSGIAELEALLPDYSHLSAVYGATGERLSVPVGAA